jgi:uncharacterized protein (DUF58 family)
MPGKRAAKGGSGMHLGGGRGVSLDFYGHSAYTPGEDIRKIDWKAYARTRNLYVKDFTEERQINVGVLLDRSASMDIGSPGKWEFAVKLALGLGYLALRQGDRLSFMTVSGNFEVLKENASGLEHFYDLLKAVPRLRPAGATAREAFTGALGCISGIPFILSDLFNAGAERILDCLCLRGQQAVLVHILAPDEFTPPGGGELKLVDAETGRVKRIHLNAAARRLYAAKVKEFLVGTREMCSRRGIAYVFARTDEAPSAVLKRALEVC